MISNHLMSSIFIPNQQFFCDKRKLGRKVLWLATNFAGIIHLSTKAVAVDMNGKNIYNNDDDSFMHISLPI